MSIPGAANPLLLRTAAAGGYNVERSLRFNSSDSAYLSRTPASAGNRKTWTWAGWVKRAKLGATQTFFMSAQDESNVTRIRFESDDTLRVHHYVGNSLVGYRQTTQVFRDASAWYHIVWVVDTTAGTGADRIKLFVNGSQITAFASTTDPNQNADLFINSTNQHKISSELVANYLDAYLADVHFIDGQALTPSSFTEVSATTGQLIPKAYTGSFGTNGFWLKFSDNSAATATTLGKDYSGNSNNWTPNNLSVTAGAGNDSLVDTPTSYGTDTGAGGEVRGNYCTLNPLNKGANVSLSNGNLDIALSGTNAGTLGTIAFGPGKWYFEATVGGTGNNTSIGIGNQADTATYLYSTTGIKIDIGGGYAYGASTTTGDVMGVAFDSTAGSITFYKNGVSQGTAFTGISTSQVFLPRWYSNVTVSTAWSFNFGQRPFAYTAPSGFKALCDTNLPAPVVAKPSTVMDVKLYTGNGSTQTISGLGFSPDLVWMKVRSTAYNHTLIDSVRGATKTLSSSMTVQEYTEPTGPTAFTSDGWSMSGDVTYVGSVNANAQTYVAWTWDAGSSTVTNTQGSITSQVRANASAGFSIVTYSFGNAPTVGHGLGVAPSLIIAKSRTVGTDWVVYHRSLGKDKLLVLNGTDAAISSANYWGSAEPSSTVFGTIGNNTNSNNRGDMVAYCFAPVAGYSSFGSYVGNGSADGPFVFCGFRPRWILLKSSSTTGSWCIYDTARNTYNLTNLGLYPNYSSAEGTETSNAIDVLSNGFKLRGVGGSDPALNGNGQTIVYAAFAESPFQYARAR